VLVEMIEQAQRRSGDVCVERVEAGIPKDYLARSSTPSEPFRCTGIVSRDVFNDKTSGLALAYLEYRICKTTVQSLRSCRVAGKPEK
jgi:hypothetical protein